MLEDNCFVSGEREYCYSVLPDYALEWFDQSAGHQMLFDLDDKWILSCFTQIQLHSGT